MTVLEPKKQPLSGQGTNSISKLPLNCVRALAATFTHDRRYNRRQLLLLFWRHRGVHFIDCEDKISAAETIAITWFFCSRASPVLRFGGLGTVQKIIC